MITNIRYYVTWPISNILFIIREVKSDMPIYINKTNAGKKKNEMPMPGNRYSFVHDFPL